MTKLELLIDWWLSDPRIWGAKQSVKLTYCRNSLEPLTKAWTQWNLKQVHLSRLFVYIHFHEKNSSKFVFILFAKYKVSSLWQIQLWFCNLTWLHFDGKKSSNFVYIVLFKTKISLHFDGKNSSNFVFNLLGKYRSLFYLTKEQTLLHFDGKKSSNFVYIVLWK